MVFSEWLQEQLNMRGWDGAELARRSDVTRGQISRVLTGSRGAGPELCLAISKGLNLPREEVFRARGWLLREPENVFEPDMDARVEKLARKLDKLPFFEREIALNAMEAMLESAHQYTEKIQELSANGQEAVTS